MDYFTIYPPGLMNFGQPEYVKNDNNVSQKGQVLAMSYVPMQNWQNLYEYDKGLMRGTVFEELDLPFKGASMQ